MKMVIRQIENQMESNIKTDLVTEIDSAESIAEVARNRFHLL